MATTEPHLGKTSNFGKGSRDQQNLDAAFPQTPTYSTDYSPDNVEKIQQILLQGIDSSYADVEKGIINDGGHFFGTVDLNYTDAPNLLDVETGGLGLPSTPWTPNPSSPDDTGEQPAFTGDMRSRPQYGSGLGGSISPSTTSPEVSAQTVGELLSGKSYAGSDGLV